MADAISTTTSYPLYDALTAGLDALVRQSAQTAAAGGASASTSTAAAATTTTTTNPTSTTTTDVNTAATRLWLASIPSLASLLPSSNATTSTSNSALDGVWLALQGTAVAGASARSQALAQALSQLAQSPWFVQALPWVSQAAGLAVLAGHAVSAARTAAQSTSAADTVYATGAKASAVAGFGVTGASIAGALLSATVHGQNAAQALQTALPSAIVPSAVLSLALHVLTQASTYGVQQAMSTFGQSTSDVSTSPSTSTHTRHANDAQRHVDAVQHGLRGVLRAPSSAVAVGAVWGALALLEGAFVLVVGSVCGAALHGTAALTAVEATAAWVAPYFACFVLLSGLTAGLAFWLLMRRTVPPAPSSSVTTPAATTTQAITASSAAASP